MTRRSDSLLILDIRGAISRVSTFIASKSKEEFSADEMMISAVAYQIQIIGEAAGHLSDEVKARYPDIPWPKLRGMRNIIAHVYHGLDPEILWDTARVALPKLLAVLDGSSS